MGAVRSVEAIERTEVTETCASEKQIGKTVYLVTSKYSGEKNLRELLIRAIERESAEVKNHEMNEIPSR